MNFVVVFCLGLYMMFSAMSLLSVFISMEVIVLGVLVTFFGSLLVFGVGSLSISLCLVVLSSLVSLILVVGVVSSSGGLQVKELGF